MIEALCLQRAHFQQAHVCFNIGRSVADEPRMNTVNFWCSLNLRTSSQAHNFNSSNFINSYSAHPQVISITPACFEVKLMNGSHAERGADRQTDRQTDRFLASVEGAEKYYK